MNKVILIGRLTRDPELRYLQTGTAVCKFTLAVDRGMSKEKRQEAEAANQQTADFIPITVWGKRAENAANYLVKGLMTAVEGRIQTSSWTAEDGSTRYGTDIVANQIHMIEWPDKQGSQNNEYNQDPGEMNIPGFHPTDNDDIPF